MKCDELKYEKLGDMMPFYPHSTLVIRKQFVDGAIGELKQKFHCAEMAKDDATAANAEYHEDIRKLKAENERLKTELDLWRDGNIIREETLNEIESTKRTMWLARARTAIGKQAYYDILGCNVSERSEMIDAWRKVEHLCINKAEEYK